MLSITHKDDPLDECTVCCKELESRAIYCSNCGVPVPGRTGAWNRTGLLPVSSVLTAAPPHTTPPRSVTDRASPAAPMRAPVGLRGWTQDEHTRAPRSSCTACGKALPPWTRMIRSTCRECAQREDQSARTTRTRIREVEGDIVTRRVLSAEAAGILHSAPDGRTLFNRVYTAWSLAGALDEPAVLALVDLMNALRLRAEDVGFEDRVRPFLYQDRIRKRLPLPVINPLTGLNPPLSLFPGELVHYYAWAALSETRVSGRRYVGGRRHTGGPPRRGTLRHALSGTRGDIVEDVEWASVAQGTLLLTNYRLLLHPAPPGRPVSIPLSSVLSLAWGKDTMTIQRRDRQSPHIFTLRRGGPIEIFQLCLDYLLRR